MKHYCLLDYSFSDFSYSHLSELFLRFSPLYILFLGFSSSVIISHTTAVYLSSFPRHNSLLLICPTLSYPAYPIYPVFQLYRMNSDSLWLQRLGRIYKWVIWAGSQIILNRQSLSVSGQQGKAGETQEVMARKPDAAQPCWIIFQTSLPPSFFLSSLPSSLPLFLSFCMVYWFLNVQN